MITVVAHEVRGDGGMERAMMETLIALLDRGWRVRLFARVCQVNGYQDLHWTPILTPRRPFIIAFPLFALVAGIRLAARGRAGTVVSLGAIVPNKVDVVIVQFCQAGFAAHRISRPSRRGWVWRLHDRAARALALASERWCYRATRVRRMTAVSDLIKQELQEHYDLISIPIDVIPNGVDLERFRPDPTKRQRERRRLGLAMDELAAVFVGGDWQRKGLEIIIEAAARARWTLIVVGHGDVAAYADRAVALHTRVHFCGHVGNPEDILCAADAFVLPSRYEGFALVTIEAAAAGLPLLVTHATGAAELANRAGIRPLPLDATAFTAELCRLRDHDLRRALGAQARAAAEELAWPRIVDAYESVYAASEQVAAS